MKLHERCNHDMKIVKAWKRGKRAKDVLILRCSKCGQTCIGTARLPR